MRQVGADQVGAGTTGGRARMTPTGGVRSSGARSARRQEKSENATRKKCRDGSGNHTQTSSRVDGGQCSFLSAGDGLVLTLQSSDPGPAIGDRPQEPVRARAAHASCTAARGCRADALCTKQHSEGRRSSRSFIVHLGNLGGLDRHARIHDQVLVSRTAAFGAKASVRATPEQTSGMDEARACRLDRRTPTTGAPGWTGAPQLLSAAYQR